MEGTTVGTDTIVIGENLVDLLVHSDRVEAVVGGGPLNVARTLARLNSPVTLVSGISGDAFGTTIRSALAADGVLLADNAINSRPTTMAVVTLGPSGPRYHFHLQNTAAFDVALPSIADARALYVGTLGLIVEPMASVSEAAFLSAPSSTLRIIDPNCRPSATADPDGFRARLSRLIAVADVVKVSVEDLDFLYGPGDHDRALALLDAGATMVIVTDGPEPISVWHHDYRLTVPVVPAMVVDTVGAGDSFIGGFIAWWLGHKLSPQDLATASLVHSAIEAASDISRRTCEQAGANPPYASDLTGLAAWGWL